jgi:hypothetical protein
MSAVIRRLSLSLPRSHSQLLRHSLTTCTSEGVSYNHNKIDISRTKIQKILAAASSSSSEGVSEGVSEVVKMQAWVRTNRSQKTVTFLQLNDGE